MADQNYANHRQWVLGFHGILFGIVVLCLAGSVWNVYHAWTHVYNRLDSSLILALTVAVLLLAGLARMFALKAQDRAIRAEENFRHYVLTGKPLDAKLTIRQTIGLRFASDAEFPALAQRAAAESISEDDIKKAVKNWKADTYRV